MVFCVAPNCNSDSAKLCADDGVRFFRFPSEAKDRKRRKEWIVRCHREETWRPGPNARLCSKHFRNDAYTVNPDVLASVGFSPGRLLLKKDAVPTEFTLTPRRLPEPQMGERSAFKKRRHSEGGEDSPAEAVEADSDDRRRNEQTGMPKRKRGRPRKNEKLFQVNEEDIPAESLDRDSGDWRRNEQIVVPRRKRGRPRKYEQVQKTSKSKAHPPEEENSHIGVYVDVAEDPEGCSENSDTLPRVHSEIRMLKEDDDDKTFVAQEWDWPELDKVKKEIEEPESVSDHFEVKHEEEMVQVKEEK